MTPYLTLAKRTQDRKRRIMYAIRRYKQRKQLEAVKWKS